MLPPKKCLMYNLLMGESDIAVKFFVEVDIKLVVAEFQKRV